MTTTEYLCRHFSRMGARLKVQAPGARQGEMIRIDVGRDRAGELRGAAVDDGAGDCGFVAVGARFRAAKPLATSMRQTTSPISRLSSST